MATDRLSLRLPELLRAGIETLSQATGRTESELAREAIEEYLRRHASPPTCYDLAEAAGLIGCIDTGLTDLSTNRKHMEGFGR